MSSRKVDWNKFIEEEENASTSQVSDVERIGHYSRFTQKRDESNEYKRNMEVQRRDPKSPFYSIKTFEALTLPPNLLKGIHAMGLKVPSKIQETALPVLLATPPRNLIAQSQSGTGKTIAFAMAILSKVDTSKNYPQILCLSPTFELAIQTGEVVAKMSKFYPDIKLKYAITSEQMPQDEKVTEQIIIGTPGKVLHWGLDELKLDLKNIIICVLDEADIMIGEQGHRYQFTKIHQALNKNCQMMLFSSTYNQEAMEYADIIVPNPLTIRLSRDEESLNNITHYYVICLTAQEKYMALKTIYGMIGTGQALIFCQTNHKVSRLTKKLLRDKYTVASLTSYTHIQKRLNLIDRFRSSQEKVLLTTNILSRGIHVEQVTLIVNFDLPLSDVGRTDYETYLHRTGRTGRFGKPGFVINLIDSGRSMEICQAIEVHFGIKINRLDLKDSNTVEEIATKLKKCTIKQNFTL